MEFYGRFHAHLRGCYISKLHEMRRKRRNSFHGHETSRAASPTPRNEDKTRIEELRHFIGRDG